jgi:DNA-binding CsgD family transcriptional regulator
VLDQDDEDDSNYLRHYGILRKSGRYPWGTGGETAEARSRDFLGMVADLKKQGFTPAEIAASFSDEARGIKFTTTDLRATTTIARSQRTAANIAQAQRLKYDKGYSNGEIARQMGLAGESSVRALLEPSMKDRSDQLQQMADMLQQEVDKKGYIDVGVGVERYTGLSRTRFDTALAMLKSKDYVVTNVLIDQVGTGAGNKTKIKVLCPPGLTEKEHYKILVSDQSKIKLMGLTQGDTKEIVADPPFRSFDSSRLGINYSKKDAKGNEIGGGLADGVIFVRPGVDDVHLGGSQYAQVRVLIDGTHYAKGMAVYKDDLPKGVDLLFNTNKTDTGNKLDALKPVKKDKDGNMIEDDPFGSATKKPMLNPDGSRRTVMNIVNEEGDWAKWSKNLASQMLSKQQPVLAKEQLARAYKGKKTEFEELQGLNNPAIKRKLLKSYSDDVDSASVHLKAAPMAGQATQVIMPLASIKPTEIYAPNFTDGDRVVLVRYPHGGVFEIPELTVNNKNPEGIATLGKQAKDAVGIHAKVAERLSGADFDGDTVLVIPNNMGKVKSKPALEKLKYFDPKRDYKAWDGMPEMKTKTKQTEMGNISNLITDMTIKGANDNEIARAVRHSMVVIDAEKHHLDYKRSAIDHGIAALKEKYQGKNDNGSLKGATTIISRSSSQKLVPYRKMGYKIDPATGEKIYNETGEGHFTAPKTRRDGTVVEPVWVPKTTKSTQGAEAKDAFDLIEGKGQPIERIYADHANKLKSLANEARKEYIGTAPLRYSKSAKAAYAPEVARLNAALNVALKNAPQERQAQILANAIVRQKRDANPDMENDELKKIKGKAIVEARLRLGARKTLVDISDREWDAIQAGAISNDKLEKILDNSDIEKLKLRATPREHTVMTSSKQQRAEQLIAAGRTASEVATILGVPLSTLTSSMRKDEDG